MSKEKIHDKYEEMSCDELSELFKQGKLSESLLTKENLEKLLEYQTELLTSEKEYNLKLIDYCTEELSRMNNATIDDRQLNAVLEKLLS